MIKRAAVWLSAATVVMMMGIPARPAAGASSAAAASSASSASSAAEKAAPEVARLLASAEALQSGGFSSYGGKLEKAAEAIRAWAAGHSGLTPSQIAALESVQKHLVKAAKMWAGGGKQAKADTLRKHAGVVEGAIAALKPLVGTDTPAPSAAAVGGPVLTVEIRPGSGPARRTRRKTTPRPIRKTARPTPPRPTPPPPSADLTPPGVAPSMGFQPTGGVYAPLPSRRPARRSTPKPKPAEAEAEANTQVADDGPEGDGHLAIRLVESNKTFGDAEALRKYLQANAEKMAGVTLLFKVDPSITWRDVAAVMNAFAEAPLSAGIRFEDVTTPLAGGAGAAPGGRGFPATPAGPVPAVLTRP